MENVVELMIWVCLVVSLFSVTYQRKAKLLWAYPPYFTVAIATFYYGLYLRQQGRTNIPLYNVFDVFEFAFNFFILRSIIENPRIRKILLWLIIGFPVFEVLNAYVYHTTNLFNTVSYGIGCLLVALFCIFYFVELFQLPKAIDLLRSPAFWIATAILFSHTCTFPYWGMVNMLSVSLSAYKKAYTLVTVINILSYVLYVFAFLCRIKIRKSTS